jgi:K+-transporting ATPase ATPase C chain
MKQLRPALLMFLVLTVVTGVAYPLAVTAISQVVFPRQANGSLIVTEGKVVGSALIGQPFDDPKYDALTDAARGRIDALKAADPGNKLPIPVDLVTASGQRSRPEHQPGGRPVSAGARGPGAPLARGDRSGTRRPVHSGTAAGRAR